MNIPNNGIIYNNEILKVNPLSHLSELKLLNITTLNNLIEEYIEELKEIEKVCEELEKSEGFGEWHNYEMARDNAYGDVLEEAYKWGILRFHVFGRKLYIEGSSEGFNDNKKVLYKLSNETKFIIEQRFC